MNNSYDLHSWSKLYRQERLAEARVWHLEHRAKAHRRPRSEEQGLWSRLGEQAAAALRLS
jgi:hypothetical protein